MKGEIRNSKVETKDGGPAFPSICDEGYLEGIGNAGMSLRDYFAAQAIKILELRVAPGNPLYGNLDELAKIRAAHAYVVADAMLEARGR